MITCNLSGGLGNQLFQIFTTISLSIKYNIPFFFIDTYQLPCGRHTYWNTFLSGLSFFLKSDKKLDRKTFKTIKEADYTYQPISILPNINNNIILYGYFQSPSYFTTYKTQIRRFIKIDDHKQKLIHKYNINTENINDISIHFRLGDYKNYKDTYVILDKDYYKNALKYILETKQTNKNVIYFCEKNDLHEVLHTINYLKQEFSELTFTQIDFDLEDWEQLLIMSISKYNIIANSTFSWWAAYFNDNSDHIVCYPDKWFNELSTLSTKDLFPKHWIKI